MNELVYLYRVYIYILFLRKFTVTQLVKDIPSLLCYMNIQYRVNKSPSIHIILNTLDLVQILAHYL
jgi:hypothetical protein